ncbi:MAG: NAD(P)/FAD-dependent oxidoreductase [Deltaproteobacteria bacterium]|nr:NAD(P)/FAD-dependent oxidoreductase [Deltaproteobacteria bacterium]
MTQGASAGAYGFLQEITERERYGWVLPPFPRRRPSGSTEHDVVVLGAGLGGLAAAALLARAGLKVLVAERAAEPGGFATSWAREAEVDGASRRFVFSTGAHDVSGVSARGPVTNLLRRLGREGALSWHRLTHEYRVGGERLVVPPDYSAFREELARRFPAERDGLARFFGEMRAVYEDLYGDSDTSGGVPSPPRSAVESLSFPFRHPVAFRALDLPYREFVARHVREPRLRRLLSVLEAYLSDDGRVLSTATMAFLFGYYLHGGFYPAGGLGRLVATLVEVVAAHGGAVTTRAAASAVLVHGGRAVGVELVGGERHYAHAVVAAIDVFQLYRRLLPPACVPEEFLARFETARPSTSALTVYLGLRGVPALPPLVFAPFADGRELHVSNLSAVDPSLAPAGCSAVTLFTMIPATEAPPWLVQGPDYAARKEALADELVARLEELEPGVRARLLFRQVGTPATFARYGGSEHGGIYGPALGGFRPSYRSPVKGLFLAGAGVFPGPGVEGVVISGTLAADAVLSSFRSR